MSTDPILEMVGLSVEFPTASGDWRRAVEGLSLSVGAAERVGIVGASGSGKSVTALAALGLVQEPGRRSAGTVTVAGTELFSGPPERLRTIRGGEVGMVFQEASEALNPVFTIGFQLAETVRAHRSCSRTEAREAARRLLDRVALDGGDGLLGAFPHQLSGGQLQRIVIAIALAGDPRLLVADEPTSALDLVTQARILDLLRRLTEDDVALLLISHDLAVVGGLVERVVVMLAGRVVEEAPTGELLARPLHPYTRRLLASASEAETQAATAAMTGSRPVSSAGQGCVFAGRCPLAQPQCRVEEPPLAELSGDRRLRCPVVLEVGDG